MKKVEEISAAVVDAAFHLHRDLGPGLLESVYEAVLAKILRDRGLAVKRQKPQRFHIVAASHECRRECLLPNREGREEI